VLETKQATVTAYLLAELAEYGIVLFSCDDSHMPSGIFQPFHQHSRFAETACLQAEWSEPFKKRCWQRIIQEKIANQARVLKTHACANAENLEYLIDKVQSGDETNVEAFASRIYWDSLFERFRRHAEDKRNSALNYGYAILRGAIARYLSSSGFIPCFGVHHCNKLNAFNLADDVIEPFRPFVDSIVFSIFESCFDEEAIGLTIQERQALVSVLSSECAFKGEKINVLKACELSVNSLSGATKQKNYNILQFPKLIMSGRGAK
jgi:CRISPR-associated protein Cas1